MKVTLGLGTNLGDRAENLRLAIQLLAPTVAVGKISSIYETAPWGFADQPAFYNLALIGETELGPRELLSFVKHVEARMGREKTFRYGPRQIDIDILFYENEAVQTESLTIPHPRYKERRFVLEPLCEIAPDGADPVSGEPFETLRRAAPPDEARRLDLPTRAERSILRFGVRTYAMGILNLTPDSFSRDGVYADLPQGDAAIRRSLAQADDFLRAGADILDLGAESTRPGFRPVPEAEEIARLLPVLSAIRERFPEAILSIDTMKAATAEAALQAGADWINDVSGGDHDPRMRPLAAEHGCVFVAMRWKAFRPDSEPIADQAARQLKESANKALSAGIRKDRLILDPGIGFGTDVWDNVELMRALPGFSAIGFPILIGPSRKSVVGKTLRRPTEERIGGTAALVAAGIAAGVDVVTCLSPPDSSSGRATTRWMP